MTGQRAVASWTAAIRRAASRRAAIDRRALAAFRIALGALLLADLGLRARFLADFYTDAGVLPRPTLAELYPTVGRLSLHGLSGGLALQAGLFAVAGAAALALLVGYRSRLAAAVSLVFLLSLHARNPLVLNAGDSLLRQLLFWGLFLPLGARWSADAARSASTDSRVASPASAALLLQVVVVYTVNAAIKLRGGRWTDGTALRYVFSLDQFTVLLGDALADLPWLLGAIERTWLAMLAVSWLLVVLRGRARAALAGLFVAAHVGMALTMQLGVFPLVSVAALVPFFHPPAWDAVEERIARPVARRLPDPRPPRELVSPSPATRRRVGRAGTAVVVLGIAVMLGHNGVTAAAGTLGSADDAGLDVGEPRWRMFAPNPPSTDGWYVVRGERASGEAVDALHGGPPTWDRPPDLAATYPSARWRKFLTTLRWRDDPALYRSFAGYICARGGLRSVAVYFVAEPTNLDGPERRERRRLGRFDCDALSRT